MMRDDLRHVSTDAEASSNARPRTSGAVCFDVCFDVRAALDRVEPADEPVLSRFREALDQIYGERLGRVVLFGSRARGDAIPGSDYDIAIFLKAMPDRWLEIRRLADLRVDFIDQIGVFFDAKPFAIAAWDERTPLMHDIRRDGRDI